jgi:hypothetical protein
MTRLALSLLVTSLALGATSVSAQSPGGQPACAKGYKDFWQNLDSSRSAKMPADRLAELNRAALRAYDACQAGDEQGARVIFERLTNWDNEGAPGPFNPNGPR